MTTNLYHLTTEYVMRYGTPDKVQSKNDGMLSLTWVDDIRFCELVFTRDAIDASFGYYEYHAGDWTDDWVFENYECHPSEWTNDWVTVPINNIDDFQRIMDWYRSGDER